MTIIFETGNEFWIEQLEDTVTIPNGAGLTDSGVLNLERSGRCLGFSVTVITAASNDNSQAIGSILLLDQGSGSITYGELITGVVTRIQKLAGTAGNTVVTVKIMLFMRGRAV